MSTGTQQWRLALEAEYESRRSVWSDIGGHLEFLHDRAAAVPGARVLELGVRWGTSTAALLYGVERVGGHLWSVDLQAPTVPSWWPLTGRWTLTVGDDLDPAVLAAQPDGVDLLLLDTSHDYQHTLAELRAYVPKVKPGGLVCCHDTELEAPDLVEPQPPYPVARALDTYCAEAGLAWVNRPHSYGMGVIEISASNVSQPG
jgi:predicted O-methyltransferase YrrM